MVRVYQDGVFRVYLYAPPREHAPPHVHVLCARGGELVVRLGDHQARPSIWRNHHMGDGDAREALRIVDGQRAMLLEEWRKLHG